MTRSYRSSPIAGFSLLELLVTIALVTLMAAYLTTSLSFGRRTWEYARATQDSVRPDVVQTLLRARISQAHAGCSPIRATCNFMGLSNKLQFAASLFSPTHVSGIHLVSIETMPSSDGHADLTLLQRLERPQNREVEETPNERRVLLKDIADIRIRYFGYAANGDLQPSWHETWVGKKWLPSLVSISVSFHQSDARMWPELIVELRLVEKNPTNS